MGRYKGWKFLLCIVKKVNIYVYVFVKIFFKGRELKIFIDLFEVIFVLFLEEFVEICY